MKSTLSPRALWAVAAVLAVVAAVRVAGASEAAPSQLQCGPGAVAVHVGTKGDGTPLPMAVATAAPKLSVADVARLNRLEVTATLAPNALGENCLTVAGRAPAKASTKAVVAPGK